MKDYTFDGAITREVLENYLSRSATAANLLNSKTLEDDLRAVRNMGLKFLGRAADNWKPEPDEEKHFAKARRLAETAHAQDPDIILQACVFEIVYSRVNRFPIPAYVFEDLGYPAEDRCFSYIDMIFSHSTANANKTALTGHECDIPDLSRKESRLWFYYRATRYIDCGYEALHMGQIHLYTANDRGMAKTWRLFDKIREYGRRHARRHKVLLDAHTHGVNVRGMLLFDYHAMPFTRCPIPGMPGEKLVFVREGFSEGGKNINGWEAEAMPYLMEFDNWGGKTLEDFGCCSYEERAWKDWWGYDQIGWFANQPEEERNRFLEYTWRWTAVNNPNAYFEIPFRRTLGSAGVILKRGDTGEPEPQNYYRINTNGPECPSGFGQEETAKRLLAKSGALREAAANPPMLIDYGAKDIYDPETGMKLPEKIVVYGSFQPMAGAVENDSNSEITRMYYIGDNTYTLSMVILYSGQYDFGVSTYGTLSATYSYDRFPRSGCTNKGVFTVSRNNAVIRFRYRFTDNIVSVEDIDDDGNAVPLAICSTENT